MNLVAIWSCFHVDWFYKTKTSSILITGVNWTFTRLKITNIKRASSSTDGKMGRFPFNSLTFSEKGRLESMWFSERSNTRVLIFVQFLRAKHQIIILHKAVSAGEVLIHCRFLHGKLMESKCFPSVHRALNARRICTTLALTARKITEIHIIFYRNVLSLFYL